METAGGQEEETRPASLRFFRFVSLSSPCAGHDCLCSRISRHCPDTAANTYVATTASWPDGPWRLAPVKIGGVGWAPYNATLASIGTSNPSAAPWDIYPSYVYCHRQISNTAPFPPTVANRPLLFFFYKELLPQR